nr:radical SAM protein [Roseburia sp.]
MMWHAFVCHIIFLKMRKYKNAFIIENNNNYILFNIYSGAIASIEKKGTLENTIDEMKYKLLKKNLIIMEEDASRLNAISRYITEKSKLTTDTLTITDVSSYSCNLNCVYCMQQNTFKNVKELTIKERIKVWKRLIDITKTNRKELYLFGGEPFLRPKYVENLLREAHKQGIIFDEISAVTNGTMIDEKIIALINNYKLCKLQITLDGLASIHNKRRNNESNKNYFDIIINNIHYLLKKTKVQIIINTVLDAGNCINYKDMIDYLLREFDTEDTTKRIYFNVGMECHPQNKSVYTKENILNMKKYGMLLNKYNEYIQCQGGNITSILPAPLCVNSRENDIIVAPDGDIYKCMSGIGISQFRLCTKDELFEDDLKFYYKQALLIENDHREECFNCDYYAICNGGCKYSAYINKQDIDCQKEYYENRLPGIVQLMYNEGIKTGEVLQL